MSDIRGRLCVAPVHACTPRATVISRGLLGSPSQRNRRCSYAITEWISASDTAMHLSAVQRVANIQEHCSCIAMIVIVEAVARISRSNAIRVIDITQTRSLQQQFTHLLPRLVQLLLHHMTHTHTHIHTYIHHVTNMSAMRADINTFYTYI